MDVDISNCISQCYDGASVMSGCNTGVRLMLTQRLFTYIATPIS